MRVRTYIHVCIKMMARVLKRKVQRVENCISKMASNRVTAEEARLLLIDAEEAGLFDAEELMIMGAIRATRVG